MSIAFSNLFAPCLEGDGFAEFGQADQQLIHPTGRLGSERKAQDRHCAFRVLSVAFFVVAGEVVDLGRVSARHEGRDKRGDFSQRHEHEPRSPPPTSLHHIPKDRDGYSAVTRSIDQRVSLLNGDHDAGNAGSAGRPLPSPRSGAL